MGTTDEVKHDEEEARREDDIFLRQRGGMLRLRMERGRDEENRKESLG